MKRKLFIVLISFLTCFCCILPFAGCTLSDDGWEEVQSITYTIGTEKTTLTSKLCWNITREEIDKTEYDNAPENQKVNLSTFTDIALIRYKDVKINRQQFITDENNRVGFSYFTCYEETIFYYEKATYIDYTIIYVKVKFLDDKTIEIDYDNIIIKIVPESYKVTYFLN